MNWTIVWVGLTAGIVAYLVDFVLWSFVFTKGMRELSSVAPGQVRMGPLLAKSFANALVFGLVFALSYAKLRGSLWAGGIPGGMEFGTILWLPTIAIASVGNAIWLDRVRPVARANFWTWLIKLNAAGIVAALFIR